MIGGCIRFTQLSIMLHMYDTVLYGLVKAINWLCIFASQIVECSLHTRSASTDNLAATLIIPSFILLFYAPYIKPNTPRFSVHSSSYGTAAERPVRSPTLSDQESEDEGGTKGVGPEPCSFGNLNKFCGGRGGGLTSKYTAFNLYCSVSFFDLHP